MGELYNNNGLEQAGHGPEDMAVLEPVYNRHYITVDAQGRVTDGWSDGPNPDRDTTQAVCINEQGGYQFRLTPDRAENPPLRDMDGVPLYKWDGEAVALRTEAELTADRPDPLEEARTAKLAQLSAACNAAITAGCGVTLPDGSEGHISLTAEDQINLTNAVAAVEGGAEAYPYHLDGELCALYPAAAVLAMGKAATAHKLYHTTYYNHLAAWVRRCGTAEEVSAIAYGAALPDDLAANMEAILGAAGGDASAV